MTTRRLLPGAGVEGVDQGVRQGKYGEQFGIQLGAAAYADEGSYFVGTNAALGTVVATTTSITAYDATKPVFALINGGSKNIYLDYLRLIWGQVPTSASTWHWSMEVDPLATRYASAGTAVVPKNMNPSGGSFGGTVYIGAPVTVAAGTSRRYTHHSIGRTVIPVINDEVFFDFGGKSGPGSTLGGTVAVGIRIPVAPTIVAPGETFLIMGWAASSAAAPSWEYEFGVIER